MAVSLLHAFVSAKANSTDTSLVRPVNWNAQHTLTAVANSIIGADGSGNALDGNLFWAAGTLIGGTATGSTLSLESTSAAGSGDFINFLTGSQVERMRVDTSGRVLIGSTASLSDSNGQPLVQAHSASGGSVTTGIFRWDAIGVPCRVSLNASHSGTIGTHAANSSGDPLTSLVFSGDDGTNFKAAGRIDCTADAAISTGIVPGRLAFLTANTSGTMTERLRIDSGGALVTGGVAQQTSIFSNLPQVNFNAGGTLVIQSEMSWTATTNGSVLHLCHSRSNTIGTHVALNSGDDVGGIFFGASDGTAFQPAAGIDAQADANASSGATPGRLLFQTTPAASATLSERMRIDSSGNILVAGSASAGTALNGNTGPSWLTIIADGTVSNAINVQEINNNGAPGTINLSKTRGAVNAHTALTSTDGVFTISAWGDDGTSLHNVANINANVDGSVSTNVIPMRLDFQTGTTTTASTRMRIDSSGNVQCGVTLGYGVTGASGTGGTVTQATSRTTGVTLNKICGEITLVSAAGSATPATFTVTNSTVAATDVIILNQHTGADKYELFVTAKAAGSFSITFFTTGGTTTEQPVFGFAVIKAVTS